MKMSKIKFLLFSLLVFALVSCKDSPDEEDTPMESSDSSKYGLWIRVDDGSYILSTDDLMQDTILSPLNSGIDITSYLPAAYYAVYCSFYDGYYYLTNDGTRLSQFEVTDDNTFDEINNLAWSSSFYLSAISPNSDDDQMLFISTRIGDTEVDGEHVYQKTIYDMNTETVEMNNTYQVNIPALSYTVNEPDSEEADSLIAFVTGFSTVNDRAYFSYAYYSTTTWASVNDSAYVYVCDFPELTNGEVLKDGRAGSVTGWWSVGKSSFLDDDGNYYFTVIDSDDNTSLLRVKDGENEIDPDFIIDLSDYDLGNEVHEYLGDGIAYIQPLIVDVNEQEVVTDLSTQGYGSPVSYGSVVDDGKLYDVFETDNSEYYVCMYDSEENTLTRGLEIDDGITTVYNLVKIK